MFQLGTTYAISGILSFFGVIDLAYQTTILINNILSHILEELEQYKKELIRNRDAEKDAENLKDLYSRIKVFEKIE